MRVAILAMCVLAAALTAPAEERQFEFGEEFDGLHVTGKPFDLDRESYRLTVSGKVARPLSLSRSLRWQLAATIDRLR